MVVFGQQKYLDSLSNSLYSASALGKQNGEVDALRVNNHRISYLPGWYDMFTNVPLDFFDFGKSVINKNSIEPLLFLTLSTAALMTVDRKDWQNTKILCRRSPSLTNITKGVVNIGNGKWQLSAAGVGILAGLVFRDHKIVNTSFESMEALISAGLFVQIVKRCTGRQSPADARRSSGAWELFPDFTEYQHSQPNFYSFPSGHIASTAAILTVITENFPQVVWLKPVSYAILGVLGFSLVANDMHWYSDLPFGLAVGYTFGKIISDRYMNKGFAKSITGTNLSFKPFVDQNGMGLSLFYSLQ